VSAPRTSAENPAARARGPEVPRAPAQRRRQTAWRRFGAPALLAALVLAAGLTAACEGKPPEILRVLWQVTLVDDRELNARYTALSLFVKAGDPDGFDDLAELYLIDDTGELFWRLEAGSWQKSGSGEPWIGSNGLRLPDGSPFPAGEYRLLLRDLGGESVEQTLRLPAVSLQELERLLPRVEVRGGEIRVSARGQARQLWLYDSKGAYLAIRPLTGDRQPVAELLAAHPQLAAGFRFKVYVASPRQSIGALSGPYFWEP
jgi:hypothetical protein